MGYAHMFYGVDLDRLKAVYGSRDEKLLNEILAAQGEELENNDGCFEDEIEEGGCPDSKAALRGIIMGALPPTDRPAVYGYVLKILCEHLGESIGGDVACVRDHPYKSQLIAAGPPLPIPVDPGDFPEMGHLTLEQIPAEMQRIDGAPKRAKRSFQANVMIPLLGWVVSLFLKGFKFRQMDDGSAAEDMEAYREVLQEALDKKLAVVSFRH